MQFARDLEPLTFDPVLLADNGSEWINYQIFEQLTAQPRPGQTGIQPGLAESWDISSNGLTYTFNLRRGVRFSNGSPMTAEDVVFSLSRAANPKKDGDAFLFSAIGQPLTSSIVALNDHTVRVHLTDPLTPLLEFLNVYVASITPKSVYLANPTRFAQHPVGTGPFMLKEFQKGQFTHVVRNPYYWKKGHPLLDGVNFPYVPDDTSRVLKLESGEVDAIADVPYSLIEQLGKTPGITVKIEQTGGLDAIWLNNKRKPLNDVLVRRALNYATNKEAIVKAVLFGHADIANSMSVRVPPFWSSSVKPYPYDLAKAKQLIKASSVPHGFDLTLLIYPSTTVEQIGQIVEGAWSSIGVKTSLQSYDVGTVFTDFAGGSYQAAMIGPFTIDCTAPEELAELQFDDRDGTHGFFTFYENAASTKLYERCISARTMKERIAANHLLQQQTMDEAPIVPIDFTPGRTGLRSNVMNFHTNIASWWFLDQVWLS